MYVLVGGIFFGKRGKDTVGKPLGFCGIFGLACYACITTGGGGGACPDDHRFLCFGLRFFFGFGDTNFFSGRGSTDLDYFFSRRGKHSLWIGFGNGRVLAFLLCFFFVPWIPNII